MWSKLPETRRVYACSFAFVQPGLVHIEGVADSIHSFASFTFLSRIFSNDYESAMTGWFRNKPDAPTSYPGSALPTPVATQTRGSRDPNAPDDRLDCESKCVYERNLPGSGYITAHVTRLQDGFYDSPATHGDTIDNVRFLAIKFVFHPSGTVNRFQAATVTISLHDDTNQLYSDPVDNPALRMSSHGIPVPAKKPKFIRFAPHVLFGGVSPETLDWNFNLAGTLGVSQAPATASVNPSVGVKSSYKLYQMMRIQGSTRTCRARPFDGSGYDIEDGEVVWTMEENALQKSGLPREMTFVMLITKGDIENVILGIKIDPRIATRYGHYPKWYCGLYKYQPLSKDHLDLDRQLGQNFLPETPGRGYNFANLATTFNNYVSLPGTTYSVTDHAFNSQLPATDNTDTNKQSATTGTAPATGGAATKQQQPSGNVPSPIQQYVPSRSQSVPPPQASQPSDNEPADYHIYLHNPRSINLHATPPPPHAVPALPQLPNLANPLNAKDPVPRSRPTVSDRTRVASPANTRLKRRSIDIGNLTGVVMPSHSQPTVRNFSGGSLRRSRSRTDLRSSPLVEDSSSHSSDSSQLSPPYSRSARLNSNKENVPVRIKLPSLSPELTPEENLIIPMEAPSPPDGGSSVLSPPLPTNFSLTAIPSKTTPRLPFEMRRSHSDKDRPNRTPRARDSPSPLRKQREITPSPNNTSPESQTNPKSEQEAPPSAEDEIIDMRENDSTPIPIPNLNDIQPADDPEIVSSRRERTALRDISPYAYAITNGLEEDWDESKGDLKKMRARKRLSLPATAHYSYITAPGDLSADKDWDER